MSRIPLFSPPTKLPPQFSSPDCSTVHLCCYWFHKLGFQTLLSQAPPKFQNICFLPTGGHPIVFSKISISGNIVYRRWAILQKPLRLEFEWNMLFLYPNSRENCHRNKKTQSFYTYGYRLTNTRAWKEGLVPSATSLKDAFVASYIYKDKVSLARLLTTSNSTSASLLKAVDDQLFACQRAHIAGDYRQHTCSSLWGVAEQKSFTKAVVIKSKEKPLCWETHTSCMQHD